MGAGGRGTGAGGGDSSAHLDVRRVALWRALTAWARRCCRAEQTAAAPENEALAGKPLLSPIDVTKDD